MGTNYEWAALVMSRCSPTITPTDTNTDNFTRWMRAENPDTDWWHFNNPLNCGLDDGSADGAGSYPDLDFAATETARVLSQSNMRTIYNALYYSSSTAVFSAGCAASAWSTGGYHGNPGYIAAVPQEPVIESGQSFTVVSITSPTPAIPTPPNPTPTPQLTEANMIARDNVSGGVWVARPNGDIYTYFGAPYIGPLPKYTAQWGIGTPQNPVVGIVSDGAGGFILAADSGGPEPSVFHIPLGPPPPYAT